MENKAELLYSLAPLMFAKITEAQKSLAEWIVPDSKISDRQVLNLLLGILDDQELVKKMREIIPLNLLEEKLWTESPNVERTTYKVATQTLEIEFKNKNVYQYFDVPPEVWERLTECPSIGSFLAREVKGHYRYSRV